MHHFVLYDGESTSIGSGSESGTHAKRALLNRAVIPKRDLLTLSSQVGVVREAGAEKKIARYLVE